MPRDEAAPQVRWLERLAGSRFRPLRVIALLAVVVTLSLADLYMTLVHLLHFGMLEANPVARQIMEYGSPAALIIWKLLTVGLAVGILACFRRRGAAELAAAFCCCVLLWLTGRWIHYNVHVAELAGELQVAAHRGERRWVTMVEEP